MARPKAETIVEAQLGVFLDLKNCGSSVQWHVEATATPPDPPAATDYYRDGCFDISGEIVITDCNRTIRWSLSDDKPLEKLDRAIDALQACRRALKSAIDARPRVCRRLGIKEKA